MTSQITSLLYQVTNKGKSRNSDCGCPDFKSVQAASKFHPLMYLPWVDASKKKPLLWSFSGVPRQNSHMILVFLFWREKTIWLFFFCFVSLFYDT